MRRFGLGATVLLGLALSTLQGPTAQADPYRWCSYYGGVGSTTYNCGFNTYEQCMANVTGIGGWCERNPRYDGRPVADEYSKPRRTPRSERSR